MTLAEQETIILINQQDLRDGYFVVTTTDKNHYEKLKKRVGKHLLKDEQLDHSSWKLHIDERLLSRATLSIKNPSVLGRVGPSDLVRSKSRQSRLETTKNGE